ncbi:acyltransferase [Sphingopyxis sp. SE2]|uniref:acyltransferase family protein n=1 Tax=unclassified Sphingopyxis TaxID=2614943 RepID=UPI00050EB4E8|nr:MULTISPECIES: acyltransferase [unclassified Sphingopyxis]KGB53642.1 Acyltransferase 3 [Sphingopyxis sp. LC363]MDT7527912.1 acyltransferase [Sphingopyxis sp. SE2]
MKGRLTGLDGLRGVAALMVLAHHTYMASHDGIPRGAGYLAVDFFFMLSGYVMARTYESGWTGPSSTFSFLAVRLRRLWPTMTVGALIGSVSVWMAYSASDATRAMINLVFIPYFLGERIFPLNGPAWSIFFELVVNLLHVLVLRRMSTRSLIVVAAAMVPFLLAGAATHGLDVGSRPDTFVGGFPRVLLSYTIGIILWRSWRDAPNIKVSTSFAFLAMPLFFGATAMMGGNSRLAGLCFVVIICPMIIAGGLRFPAYSRWAGLATIAGAVSFPLYAVHDPILWLASDFRLGSLTGIACVVLAVMAFPSVRRAIQNQMGNRRRHAESVA